MPPGCRIVVVLLLMAVACGQSDTAADDGALDPTGPLEALPACEPPPTPAEDDVTGLIVPDEVIVQQVTPGEPLVNVAAYVPMTPVQFELAYDELDGVTVLHSENEIFEAELLVSDGTHRNFLKASATCSEGAQLIVVIAPEVDAEGLPVPQQATTVPAPAQSP